MNTFVGFNILGITDSHPGFSNDVEDYEVCIKWYADVVKLLEILFYKQLYQYISLSLLI